MSFDSTGEMIEHQDAFPSNAILILKQTLHPKYQRHRFGHTSTCPVCGCEFVFILRQNQYSKEYGCQNCFSIFEYQEDVA